MHQKSKLGVILAISAGIIYGIASIVFKYGIDLVDYGSLISNTGLWISAIIFILTGIAMFTRLESSYVVKILFVLSLIYLGLFMMVKVSFIAMILLIGAFILAFLALFYIDASIAWPLTGCKYAVCSLIAYLFLGEVLTFVGVLGLVLILIGTVFLALGGEIAKKPAETAVLDDER